MNTGYQSEWDGHHQIGHAGQSQYVETDMDRMARDLANAVSISRSLEELARRGITVTPGILTGGDSYAELPTADPVPEPKRPGLLQRLFGRGG